jgi:hypothetical protein
MESHVRSNECRAAALKILLAHFPNAVSQRDIERSYEPDVVRDPPSAMSELRERLEANYGQAQAPTWQIAHLLQRSDL